MADQLRVTYEVMNATPFPTVQDFTAELVNVDNEEEPTWILHHRRWNFRMKM